MSETERASISCDLCGVGIETVEAAIDAGWEPSYYRNGEETGYPLCPHCAETRCRIDGGELVLIETPSR